MKNNASSTTTAGSSVSSRKGISRAISRALIIIAIYVFSLVTTFQTKLFDTLTTISKWMDDEEHFEAVNHGPLSIITSNNNGSIGIDDNHITTYESTVSQYYDFPSEPLYTVLSTIEEAIGSRILNDSTRNPLQNCAPTVQFRLSISSSSSWTLQSMMLSTASFPQQGSDNGTVTATIVVPKLYGGDEIYVQWESDFSFNNTQQLDGEIININSDGDHDDYDMGIAHVTDMKDGTYTLKFVRPPMLQHNNTKTKQTTIDDEQNTGKNMGGRLTIYYEYTCSIGSIFGPNKDHYTRAGEVLQTLNTPSSIQIPRPHINDFIPPNIDQTIDLSKYDVVVAFGDSLVMQLVRRYLRNGMWSNNIIWSKNVFQCLSNPSDARNMIFKFHDRHGEQIQNLTNDNQRVAVITGTSSWDAMRGCVHEDLQDHVNAIRTYINNVTTSFPNVDVYWKSPSSFFLHRYTTYIDAYNETLFKSLKPKFGVKPLKPRYINYHVPQQLYTAQKELMTNELHIPFLDLYESYQLSAPWTVPGDSRHFHDDLSRLQLSYFWPGLLLKPITVKR